MVGPFLFTSLADGTEYTQVQDLRDRHITTLLWSPTGERIFFVEEVSDTQADFYLINPDGSGLRKITSIKQSGSQIQPAWGSGGECIYFRDKTAENWDIYQMNIRNGEVIQITATGQHESHPACSPQGRFLSYNRDQSSHTDLIVYDSMSNTEKNLTKGFESVAGEASWSPDGKILVYRATEEGFQDHELYKINNDITGHKQLTYNKSVTSQPVWSPDGDKIMYLSEDALVFVDSSDGTELTRILMTCLFCLPTWSPDGELIAYNYSGEIRVMHLESKEVRQLTDDPEHVNEALPTWSPHIK